MQETRVISMKLFVSLFFTIQVLSLYLGCSNPSESDLQKLQTLREIYGKNYSFSLSDDFYLEVKSRKNAQTEENQLISIYKVFFFDASGTRERDTTFIYLNWYNHRGRFQYQIFYDPSAKEFRKSKASHY